MQGLIESATAILVSSERRLETIAANVSNVTTPGYKRQISFQEALGRGGVIDAPAGHRVRADFRQGQLQATGAPMDLGISGAGFFQLRSAEGFVYTRNGQFRVAEDGSVVSAAGHVLQQEDGGDVIVAPGSTIEVLEDGTVVDQGRPVARIGVFAPDEDVPMEALGGSLFSAGGHNLQPAEGTVVRQAMVEASNVSVGDEMVAMMAAARQAEGGARLVQVYDELLGRAITAFGQGGR